MLWPYNLQTDGGNTANEHLATYLNDHLAGLTVALELLEELEAEGTGITKSLTELRADIEADRKELQIPMARLGNSESRTRKVSGWLTLFYFTRAVDYRRAPPHHGMMGRGSSRGITVIPLLVTK